MHSRLALQSPSSRKMTLWVPVAALVLLLAVGGIGNHVRAGEQALALSGAREVEGNGTAEAQPITSAPLVASAARTINYTYDNAGRLVSADYGGGKTLAYTYDNAGNLIKRCALTANFDATDGVDIAEIMQVAGRFGAQSGEPLYQAQYDLDGDLDIDAADVQQAAGQWRGC